MVFLIVLLIGWWVVRERSVTAKNAYFIFFCGPVLFCEIFLVSLLRDGPLLLRLGFLSAAIFLPASLYFLFIAARRESLFNAFTTNLTRLGLLRRWWTAGPTQSPSIDRKTSLVLETQTCFHRRIKSYFDRFAAIYGSFDEGQVDRFVKAIEVECGLREPDAPTGQPTKPMSAGGTFDFPELWSEFGDGMTG
jgi:hypothetical protein